MTTRMEAEHSCDWFQANSQISIYILHTGATFFWGLQGSISSKDTTMYPKLIQDLTVCYLIAFFLDFLLFLCVCYVQGWNVKSIACGQRHIAVSADDNVIIWGIGTTSGELVCCIFV